MSQKDIHCKILLTGATGYIGGRLLKALEEKGYPVRCLTRRPENLIPRAGTHTVVISGDILDEASLTQAMEGIETAYYLVHSMAEAGAYAEKDRKAAKLFGEVARKSKVKRIIYLGGLADPASSLLSPHFKSRLEVGKILRNSGVTCIEFRASVIIGSGSFSFEMIRSLVERLPIMITPRWVSTPAQPIAIEDVIAYLVAALDLPGLDNRVYEIGGADRVSYKDLMKEYAFRRELHRVMIPVPFLTPRLSSLWLGLVTPLYARIGKELILSLRTPSVVKETSALKDFPITPRGYREAVSRALIKEDHEFAETRWSDSLSSSGYNPLSGGLRYGSRFIDSRTIAVSVPPDKAFIPIQHIGGEVGWFFADYLWSLRGMLDLIAGGVGMRRGRRNPHQLLPGDTLDCWRVESIEQDKSLRLIAEMKLPGRAWLEFEVTEGKIRGSSVIRQTASFDPLGIMGLIYWYALYPLHQLIFQGMLNRMARSAVTGHLPRKKVSDPQLEGNASKGWSFLLFLVLCFGAGGLGGRFTANSISTWYANLIKPPITPPAWVFGPVWSLLYFLMAVAGWLIWQNRKTLGSHNALRLFSLQLILNVAWSWLFFGLRSPGAALVEIVFLWLAIYATYQAFKNIKPLAGYLLLPYLVWVSFAILLNLMFWELNL